MRMRFHVATRAVGLVVVLMLWKATPAAGQDDTYTLRVGANRIFLSDGDHAGGFYYAEAAWWLHPGAAVSIAGGLAGSTDLDFSPQAPHAWHYREYVLGELGARFDPLRLLEGERYEHRLGVKIGFSLRKRDEERPRIVLHPPAMEDLLAHGDLDDQISDADAFHVFETSEGLFGIETFQTSGTDLGWMLVLHYVVHLPRLVLGFEAGMRQYDEGTPMLNYGINLGIRP